MKERDGYPTDASNGGRTFVMSYLTSDIAASLGNGTQFCLGVTLPPSGTGLRTVARHAGWAAFCRLCLPNARVRV
jgi:hypothetical protein